MPAGDVVYIVGGDKQLHAVNAASGAASSPVTSGGAVYIAGYDDNVYAFAT